MLQKVSSLTITACLAASLAAVAGFGCSAEGPVRKRSLMPGNLNSELPVSERKITSRARLVQLAKKYIGVPYRFGGSGPGGFDCSGYVKYVYGRAGYRLPHSSRRQFSLSKRVGRPKPGDLVFYRTYTRNVSHVGIYVGNNRFLHAPRTGRTVSYTNMRYSYWRKRYAGAGSLLARSSGPPTTKPNKEPTTKPGKSKYDQELLDYELLNAVLKNNLPAFRRFLALGGNANAEYKGWSALMYASYSGNLEMVTALLGKGAKANFRSPTGWNPLRIAIHYKRTAIARKLEAAGAVRTRAAGFRPPQLPSSAGERF